MGELIVFAGVFYACFTMISVRLITYLVDAYGRNRVLVWLGFLGPPGLVLAVFGIPVASVLWLNRRRS